MGGYFNSNMYGGVFRSGELGPNAYFDSNVKKVTAGNNFFDTRYDEDGEKSDKKDFGLGKKNSGNKL